MEHTNYKEYLRDVVASGLTTGANLAAAARVQPPYISNVLRRDAHLSQGQAHAIGEHLGLTGEDLEYFLLLVLAETTDRPEHKRYLRAKVERLRTEHRRIGKRFKQPSVALEPTADADRLLRYYLDCLYQIVHMLVRQRRFQAAPEAIAARTGVDTVRIKSVLADLETLGLISRKGDKFIPTMVHTHIEAGSFLSRQNHLSWRVDALRRDVRQDAGDYRFTGIFSASPDAKERLVRTMMTEIASHRDGIRDEPDQAIYQVNLDIYSPA